MKMLNNQIDDVEQVVSPDFVRCDNCLQRFEVFSILHHIKKCSMINNGSLFPPTIMSHSPKRKYALVSSSSSSILNGSSSMKDLYNNSIKKHDSTRRRATFRVLFGRPLLEPPVSSYFSSSSSSFSTLKKSSRKKKTMKKKRLPKTIISKITPSSSLNNSKSCRIPLTLTTPLSNSMLKDLLFEDDPAQVLKSTMNSPSTSSSHNLNPIYTKEEKPGTITSTNAKMKEKKKPTEEVQEDFSTSNLTQEALKVLEEEEQIIISPIIQEIEKQQKQLETTNIDNIFLGSIVEFETWGQEEIEDFFP